MRRYLICWSVILAFVILLAAGSVDDVRQETYVKAASNGCTYTGIEARPDEPTLKARVFKCRDGTVKISAR